MIRPTLTTAASWARDPDVACMIRVAETVCYDGVVADADDWQQLLGLFPRPARYQDTPTGNHWWIELDVMPRVQAVADELRDHLHHAHDVPDFDGNVPCEVDADRSLLSAQELARHLIVRARQEVAA